MLYKKTPIAFLLLFHVLSVDSMAQEIPHFLERLTTAEGLSSNKINDIAQDDNGFLWIATSDGLNRFDGTEVVQFFHQDNTNSVSHNYVYCLKKLPGNNIAIGTQAGLDFYNSNTRMFRNFYHHNNDGLDDFNNTIVEFETDTQGNLWAASKNCVYIFDTHLALKKVIPSSLTAGAIANSRLKFIEKMLPLSNGDMLLYTSAGLKIFSAATAEISNLEASLYAGKLKFLNDLFHLSGQKKFEQYSPYASVFTLFNHFFLCIKPGSDSLQVFNEDGTLVSNCYFPYNKYPYVLWSQKIPVIDSTKLLFLFHNYGFARIPITWQNDHPVIHTPSPLMFEDHEYDAAIQDKQGNCWLATTENGLQMISPGKQYFKSDSLIDKTTGKPFKYDMSSVTRYKNSFWAATYGNGFFEIDPASRKQKQHLLQTAANDPWPNFIWNVRQVSDDTVWIGTQSGMFWYTVSQKKQGRIPNYPGKPPALDSVPITTQFIDSYGLVWIGLGRGKGLCCFNGKTRNFIYYPPQPNGYPYRYPLSIAEDEKKNIWFISDATADLTCLDRKTGRFQIKSIPFLKQKRIAGLSGICFGQDNILWLGSTTDGLIKYNWLKDSVTIYGHDKGLSNSHISSIYQDKEKRLWLITDGDLSCFDTHTEIFTSYSEKNGLPVKYPTASFYYDTITNLLYTGGNGALFYFDPDRMDPVQLPQKTIITAIHVNGKPYMMGPGEISKFRYWQNDIAIQYSAVDLTNGPGTKYAYKLVGEDTGWIMAGNQRQINFSRLAPGNYTFMVRASNSAGVWSTEIANIRFNIRPPFTKTAWFYTLIVGVMGALFYLLYRFRLSQLMRTEQVRSEISKNLHDEVGASLTNISLSSLLAQKQLHNESAVSRLLERIYQDSQNVSEAMRDIVWSINPRIDTMGEALPRMLRYASELLEAKDMELKAEIAPEIEQVKLTMQERKDLYMIFKETINNLAKHSKATQVIINFHLRDKKIMMIIADDGIGFDTNSPLINNGIKNMKERAKNHHWGLRIESAPGKGAAISLEATIA